MKFNKLSQLFLVSALGLAVAVLMSACGGVTIDRLFVACTGTGSTGEIRSYAVDSQSGAVRSGATTVSSGGAAPVAMLTSANYAHLYVANATSQNVVHFTVASSGSLTKDSTVLTTNGTPVALATNSAGTYLYVLSSYSSTEAVLDVYALSSGTIGAKAAEQIITRSSDAITPTGLNVLVNTSSIPGNAVYVTLYDTGNAKGYVYGYNATPASGALAALANSPYEAGVKPVAAASDPTNSYLYVTDYSDSQVIGYTILGAGQLTLMRGGNPFSAGTGPTAVAVDPRGEFVYVANALAATVSAYDIALQNGGSLTQAGTNTNQTDTLPVAIVVDPAIGRYVYTANNLGNSISGFRLDSNTGVLSAAQSSPYTVGDGPTALAIVPHGNHAVQSVSK